MGGQLKSGAQTDKATGLKGLQSRVYTWTALGGSTPNNQQFCKSYSQKTDNSSTQTASNPKIPNIKAGTQAQKRTEPIMKPEQATCNKTRTKVEQQCNIIITNLIKVINININIRQLP